MLSVESFKAYARLDEVTLSEDGEEETALLCYETAVAQARMCGVPVDKLETDGNRMLELYVYALAGHYYDNRNFVSNVQSYTGDQYTQRMMTRMRIALESEGWF